MFNKIALSLAVLALIGDASARHHHHSHKIQKPRHSKHSLVQFIDDINEEDIDQEFIYNQKPTENPLGVRFVQASSDPINGSLGAPKAKRENLTPEQQFEWDMRRLTPPKFEDDEDVKATAESIKIAEAKLKGKMPSPDDAAEQAKVQRRSVEYQKYDSDDEDDETVETRKSIKTAEKLYKTRFFINAKD